MIRACLDAFKKGRAVKQLRSRRAVARAGTIWKQPEIKVFFMDGSSDLQYRVMKAAGQWSPIMGIPFVITEDRYKSDVRITFASGGSWSYAGTQALDVSPRDPTMQLGWLTENSDDIELKQVVLHEFGHLVGLLHEHQNPQGGIQWDKERVYSFYMGYPNYWSKAQVDTNVFEAYSSDMVKSTAFDPHSIMLYPIPEEFTLNDYSVDWNLDISPTDAEFVRELYNNSARG